MMLKPNQPNSIFISARYCTCTKMKIGKKNWQIVVIRQIRQSFFSSKVFTIRYIMVNKNNLIAKSSIATQTELI